MPTITAPATSESLPPQKPEAPPAPPTPISSNSVPERKDSNITAILFISATVILFGLLSFFVLSLISKSKLFDTSTPELEQLPAAVNTTKLEIKGNGPKSSTITINYNDKTAITKTDRKGKFAVIAELNEDGKYTFSAVATKKFLFWKRESGRSAEVSTLLDTVSPSLKITSLPKTVSTPEYTIKGSTTEPTEVTIILNEESTTIKTDEKNTFSYKVKFKEGANKVLVSAKDQAGNTTTSSEQTITYSKKVVATNNTTRRTSTRRTGTLPNSAGPLQESLNAMFTKYLGVLVLMLGTLGYFASSSTVWIYKTYIKRS